MAKLSAQRTGPLYPQEARWIDPWAVVRPERLSQFKIPVEPATFWFVAQCLNQRPHRVPRSISSDNSISASYTDDAVFARYGGFFACLIDKGRSNAPPASRCTPRVGEVLQSMTAAKETIAVIITQRKSNKISVDRLACAFQLSKEKDHCTKRKVPSPQVSIQHFKL